MQILRVKSVVVGNEETVKINKGFLKDIPMFILMKSVRSWNIPAKFVPVHSLYIQCSPFEIHKIIHLY